MAIEYENEAAHAPYDDRHQLHALIVWGAPTPTFWDRKGRSAAQSVVLALSLIQLAFVARAYEAKPISGMIGHRGRRKLVDQSVSASRHYGSGVVEGFYA